MAPGGGGGSGGGGGGAAAKTQSLSSLSSLAAAVDGMKENGALFISPSSLSAASAAGRL